jgi:hypothetical protein
MSRHVLDELFDESVFEHLKTRRIAIDKVGAGFGRTGWVDEQILQALHGSRKTFHTRDHGFYRRSLGHLSYCIAYYDVPLAEMAVYIRRFLRHPGFNTHAKRLGKVIKITTQRIEVWQVGHSTKSIIRW